MNLRRSLLVMLCVLTIVSACSSGSNDNPSGDTTITLWHTLEEMYRDDFNQLIRNFEDDNPGIKVIVEYQGRVSEIQEKVLAENLAGGQNMPDVFPVHSSTVQTLARDGIIESLDSYI